jgi:hypothetical protein
MTNQELKEQLKKRQYNITERMDLQEDIFNWYAFKPIINAEKCTHNKKQPNIIIDPWKIKGIDKIVEIMVTGQILDQHWLRINFYTTPVKDLLPNLDLFERILVDTWNCAAKTKHEEIEDEVA